MSSTHRYQAREADMRRARTTNTIIAASLIAVASLLGAWRSYASRPVAVTLPAPAVSQPLASAKTTETTVFSGGCFWGIQAVFQHVKGVVSATSGYAGGTMKNPSYEDVSSGTTGYAESVKVVFDPSVVTYNQLLQIFFSVAHDPTELNRQGPDVGTQYRSMISYTSDAERDAAEKYIDQLNKSHVFSKPIVTQVVKFSGFWPAEAYHQNYATLHPDEPYIVYNDAPKVVNLKKEFGSMYSDKLAAHE